MRFLLVTDISNSLESYCKISFDLLINHLVKQKLHLHGDCPRRVKPGIVIRR